MKKELRILWNGVKIKPNQRQEKTLVQSKPILIAHVSSTSTYNRQLFNNLTRTVDKRHAGDGGFEKVWSHVEGRPHEQPPCAAALGGRQGRNRPFRLVQSFGAAHKVAEGVALV